MMTVKALIQSKNSFNYQFILKIISSPIHNLQEFIKMSLLAKDTQGQISVTENELTEAKNVIAKGVPLKPDELSQIKEYYQRKHKVDALKGNQWKKAMKLNDFKLKSGSLPG